MLWWFCENEWGDDMVCCDDFVKNEWSNDMVGSDDFDMVDGKMKQSTILNICF